jgi:lactate dehydrogenase-like 2-hydroxyacid dehydrogenase
VIVTPHAAFHSAESVEELRIRVAHQILDTLQGRTPECVVNRDIEEAQRRMNTEH